MASPKPPIRAGAHTTQVTRQQVSLRQGPIPSPEDLAQYEQLLPGTADRIIAMTERELAHRMAMEEAAMRAEGRHRDDMLSVHLQQVRGDQGNVKVGQVLGGVVAVISVLGAVYTAMINSHPAVSIALVGLPLASIIKALKTATDRQKK